MNENYIALHVHLIWTTKNREPFLETKIRYQLLDHIRQQAIFKGINIKIINGVEDHLHCLVSMKATQNIAKIVKDLKGESSHWVNLQSEKKGFAWQDGYGAISVSPQHLPRVTKYIFNQETHHAFKNIEDELKLFEQFAD